MQKPFLKYSLKFFTLILLGSFILSNVSLCYIVMEKCKSERQSNTCCCNGSGEDTSNSVEISKNCCCIIKEKNVQPMENITGLNESVQKNTALFSKSYSGTSFLDYNSGSVNRMVLSFHSPPKEEIYILNSNFRI